jgi:hypothetical protein
MLDPIIVRAQIFVECRECNRLLGVHGIPNNVPRGTTLQEGDVPYSRLKDVVCSECAKGNRSPLAVQRRNHGG